MKEENKYVNKFDACVKIALRHELLYRLRTIKNQRKHYINMSEMSDYQLGELCCFDEYPSECFQEKIATVHFEALIHDELLYEALLSLKPITREILILKYWERMTDKAIGEKLCMSREMVNYYRRKALKSMRKMIEETRNNER